MSTAQTQQNDAPETTQAQTAEPQSTGAEAAISANPGEAISFADLEAMESAQQRDKELEVKEEAEKQQAVDEAKSKQNDQNLDTDPNKEGSEEKTEPQATDKEGESAEKQTETKAETETDEGAGVLKTIKIKTLDDKGEEIESDLSFEAKVPVKINGETKFATVEQLVRNFSGLGALDQQFRDMKGQKEAFESDINTINQRINDIVEVYGQDKRLAMMQFAAAIGGDPAELDAHLKQEALDLAAKLTDMSESDRQVFMANAERDRIKSLHESQLTRDRQNQERTALDRRIRELQTTHEVDDKSFNDMAEELQNLKKAGHYTGDITPELIVDQVVAGRQITTAREILSAVVPDKANDQSMISSIRTLVAQNPEFTVEEMKEIVAEGLGVKSTSQVLSEKVQQTKTQTGATSTTTKSPQNEDMWSFDQFG